MYYLHHKVTRIGQLRTTLAATSNRNTLPSSPILFTLMMEAILSSETSVLIRAIRRYINEDGVHHAKQNISLMCQ
jgi:hypothetical protein